MFWFHSKILIDQWVCFKLKQKRQSKLSGSQGKKRDSTKKNGSIQWDMKLFLVVWTVSQCVCVRRFIHPNSFGGLLHSGPNEMCLSLVRPLAGKWRRLSESSHRGVIHHLVHRRGNQSKLPRMWRSGRMCTLDTSQLYWKQRRFCRIDRERFARDGQMKFPAMNRNEHLMCSVCMSIVCRMNPVNGHTAVLSTVRADFPIASIVRPKLESKLEFQLCIYCGRRWMWARNPKHLCWSNRFVLESDVHNKIDESLWHRPPCHVPLVVLVAHGISQCLGFGCARESCWDLCSQSACKSVLTMMALDTPMHGRPMNSRENSSMHLSCDEVAFVKWICIQCWLRNRRALDECRSSICSWELQMIQSLWVDWFVEHSQQIASVSLAKSGSFSVRRETLAWHWVVDLMGLQLHPHQSSRLLLLLQLAKKRTVFHQQKYSILDYAPISLKFLWSWQSLRIFSTYIWVFHGHAFQRIEPMPKINPFQTQCADSLGRESLEQWIIQRLQSSVMTIHRWFDYRLSEIASKIQIECVNYSELRKEILLWEENSFEKNVSLQSKQIKLRYL